MRTLGLFPTSMSSTRAEPLVAPRVSTIYGTISPNGRLLAYSSRREAAVRSELHVLDLKGTGKDWQVTDGGGGEPVWKADGAELFFRGGDGSVMMSLRMRDDEPPFDDEPQRLFEGDFEHSILATHPDYDVSPDGQHFYMIRGERVESDSRLRVVVGWLDSVAGGDIDPVTSP